MTLSEYTQLKQQIVFNVAKSDSHANLVNTLKQYYKDDIDSDRRFEKIIDMGQLLKILEIRDILSEDNVMPLKEVARRLNNNELIRKINEFETNHVVRQYVNYYTINNTNHVVKNEHKESFNSYNNNNPYANISINKKQRIDETIIEEIGSFWRALGRNLKISEGKIDEINSKHENISDKITEILDIFYNRKADPQRWFFELCSALEKARRRDLSKSLQNIMTMNI